MFHISSDEKQPSDVTYVDLTSDQTITGVKTVALELSFEKGAYISQDDKTFTLPATEGMIASISTEAGNEVVDLTSEQTITGVKTISNKLQLAAGAGFDQSGQIFKFPSSGGIIATLRQAPGNEVVDTKSNQIVLGNKKFLNNITLDKGIVQSNKTFSLPPTSGVLAVIPEGESNGIVDLTSKQSIQGVKTINKKLDFDKDATISQDGKEFTFPSESGQLALVPSGPSEYVDLDSEQTIVGVKTIAKTLAFSDDATLTKGSLLFELPTASGKLAIVPQGVNNDLVDLNSIQSIAGQKTFNSNLTLGFGTGISQGMNVYTMPATSGTLATVAVGPGNAYVDLTSDQLVTGVKTIDKSLSFSEEGIITQGEKKFTLPATSGTLAIVGDFVDLTSDQTVDGVKIFSKELGIAKDATISQEEKKFTLPSESGQLVIKPEGDNAFVDLTSDQLVSGVKTIDKSLSFSEEGVITQGDKKFTLPATSGKLAVNPEGDDNAYVDLKSEQTIGGKKTFADLVVEKLSQDDKTFTLPSTSGKLALAAEGNDNAYVDLTSEQTIAGKKTFTSDITLRSGVNINQESNVFVLPPAGGMLVAVPPDTQLVDTTSAQTITGIKTINSTIVLGPDAGLSQGVNTFNMPSSSGIIALVPAGTGNGICDILSNQTIIGQKTMNSNLKFAPGISIVQGSATFKFPPLGGTIAMSPLIPNVFYGLRSGQNITTGDRNTSVGYESMMNLTTGTDNVIIGHLSGSAYIEAESNNVLIKNDGVVGDVNTIRIGSPSNSSCFISGIHGTNSTDDAIPVVVDAMGKLGMIVSSERYRTDIVPAKQYDIRNLQVFNFKNKNQPDKECVGLIAEQVAQVIPELVIYDRDGLPLTIKYLDLIPMLVQQVQELLKVKQ